MSQVNVILIIQTNLRSLSHVSFLTKWSISDQTLLNDLTMTWKINK